MRVITYLKIRYSTNPSLVIFYLETQENEMAAINIKPTVVEINAISFSPSGMKSIFNLTFQFSNDSVKFEVVQPWLSR